MDAFVQAYLEGHRGHRGQIKRADYQPGMDLARSMTAEPFPLDVAHDGFNYLKGKVPEWKSNIVDYTHNPSHLWQDTKDLARGMTIQPNIDTWNSGAQTFGDIRHGDWRSAGPHALVTAGNATNAAMTDAMLLGTVASDGANAPLLPAESAVKGKLLSSLSKMVAGRARNFLPLAADAGKTLAVDAGHQVALSSLLPTPPAAPLEPAAAPSPAAPPEPRFTQPLMADSTTSVPNETLDMVHHSAESIPAPSPQIAPTPASNPAPQQTAGGTLLRYAPWAAGGLAAGAVLAWTKNHLDEKRKALPSRVHKYPTLFANQQIPG